MRLFTSLLLTLALAAAASAQLPTTTKAPLAIDRTTKRLNETALKIPSGATLTIESGATLAVESGATTPQSPIVLRSTAGGATAYSTLALAKAAAASGQLVSVGPGTYAVTESLGKAGVAWGLPANATITRADDGATGIFGDGGSSMSFSVVGDADLTMTRGALVGVEAHTVHASHASSFVSVRCRDISCLNLSPVYAAAVTGTNGRVDLDFRNMVSTTGANDYGVAAWWLNGEMNLRGIKITAENFAVLSDVNGAPTGRMYVRANEIISTAFAPVVNYGTNASAAAWVDADYISGSAWASVVNAGLNKMYIGNPQTKYVGAVETGITSGLLYVEGQKIVPGAVAPSGYALLLLGAGDSRIDIEHWDPEAVTGNMMKVTGGTVEIRGMRYIANSGSKGFEITGGTVRLVDCYINTAANSGTNPILKSGGTLILDH